MYCLWGIGKSVYPKGDALDNSMYFLELEDYWVSYMELETAQISPLMFSFVLLTKGAT